MFYILLIVSGLVFCILLGSPNYFDYSESFHILAVTAELVLICVLIIFVNKLWQKQKNKLSKRADTRERIIWAMVKNGGNLNELENFKRGLAYEFQVGKFLQHQGYEVDFRGINRGKNDGGIDVAARKNGKLALVQCKNYRNTNALDQQIVRKFLGDCFVFLNGGGRPYRAEECEFLFFISNAPESKSDIYTYQRYATRKNTPFRLEILPFNEAICEDEEFKQIFEKCLQESYAKELEQAKIALGEK